MAGLKVLRDTGQARRCDGQDRNNDGKVRMTEEMAGMARVQLH